jgi:hypothetical protein
MPEDSSNPFTRQAFVEWCLNILERVLAGEAVSEAEFEALEHGFGYRLLPVEKANEYLVFITGKSVEQLLNEALLRHHGQN